MSEAVPTSPREAIIIFHLTDRLKSELLIASSLLNTVLQLRDAEQAGGRKVLTEYFRALDREVALSQSMIKDPEMVRVQTVMTGLVGMVNAGPLHEVQGHLTWVITNMTTHAQRAMQFLMDR
ncbi:MAG: hypothetical protein JRI59_04560, partial [Deltaproteobacteria bacterium]|nr:hypothetical protein [Deltaproteobacteria bacterium]